MIGSETFIIVALRCSENIVPSALVSAIAFARNAESAFTDMKVASATVPSSSGQTSLSTVTAPSAPTNSIRASPACAAEIVADFSLAKKSSPGIDDTFVLLSVDQAPIECGFAWAYFFTARAARRSELPSRSTGFTAEPLIAS